MGRVRLAAIFIALMTLTCGALGDGMSSQENGIPGNIARPTAKAIVSSTNAAPIKLTVTGHGLTSGDVVDVYEHQTNTQANGRFAITVVDANSFLLVGSTGNGVGGATGHIIGRTMGATFAVPSDGDPRNAASVDVALEALADRTASLGTDVISGGYTLVQSGWIPILNDGGGQTKWAACTFSTSFAILTNVAGNPYWDFTGLNEGDVVDVDLTTSYSVASSPVTPALAFGNVQFVPGGSPGALAVLGGSAVAATSTSIVPLSMWAQVPFSVAPPLYGGSMRIGLMGKSSSAVGTLGLYGDAQLRYRVWRPQ